MNKLAPVGAARPRAQEALANLALASQAQSPPEQQLQLSDQYLQQIVADLAGSGDAQLADWVRQQSPRLSSPYAQLALAQAGLTQLATQAQGHLGGALAQMGLVLLNSPAQLNPRDRTLLGGELLQQLQAPGHTCFAQLTSQSSQLALTEASLQGLVQQPAPGGAWLAQIGQQAVSQAGSSDDQVLLGHFFIQEVLQAQEGPIPEIKHLALQSLLSGATPQAQANLAQVSLKALSQNHPIHIAEMGLEALQALGEQDRSSRVHLGQVFLESPSLQGELSQIASAACSALEDSAEKELVIQACLLAQHQGENLAQMGWRAWQALNPDHPQAGELLARSVVSVLAQDNPTLLEQLQETLGSSPASQRQDQLGHLLQSQAQQVPRSDPTQGSQEDGKGESEPDFQVHYSGSSPEERKIRQDLIEKISSGQVRVDPVDLRVLRQGLNTLPSDLLKALDKYRYQFRITRQPLSRAAAEFAGLRDPQGSPVDLRESTHLVDDSQRLIGLRCDWHNGKLELSTQELLTQVGRALNDVVYRKDGRPSQSGKLHRSFKEEQTQHSDSSDFAAQVFAHYQLDPQHCARHFPLAFAALEQGALGKFKVDTQAILELQQRPQPVANLTPDPYLEVRELEALNRLQRSQGLPLISYRLELQGEPEQQLEAVAEQLARIFYQARNPQLPLLESQPALVELPAASFNNPEIFEKLLDQQAKSARGALLWLKQLDQVQSDSPGFSVLARYLERFGGQTPLLLQGSQADLDRLAPALPTQVQHRFQARPLTPSMLTQLLQQQAQAENYSLSPEAISALEQHLKDGDKQYLFRFWQALKQSQIQRLTSQTQEHGATQVTRLERTDVDQAGRTISTDPLQALEGLIGLQAAKEELRSVLAQVQLLQLRQEHGLSQDPPRLNLLLAGSPGTGKTTVAKLLAQALAQIGYLKSQKFQEARVQDLVSGLPEVNVKRLFESNKGGVIFLDEMHQLKDTQEGRLAFRAMIPYLGHPEYAQTVFIGAGYPGELSDLLRDVDEGAERRFTRIPFSDYSSEELGQILDKVCQDQGRSLDEATRKAALLRLERERRRTKHFGNAGSVTSLVQEANKKQMIRLSQEPGPPDKSQLLKLMPEDFAAEKLLSPEEVWGEIEALEGLDQAKKHLRSLCQSIEYDREVGQDPLESFEPYFILDGPPGTGKTTLARLIVKLMAAYDIIPSQDVSECQGADLQAGFVGQTPTKVQKLFEGMWGQGGFIDEIGGIARAPEAFKTDAIKTMLKQMEDHRGRFILIVADYADRVNEFLQIDPGIARRFGHRISLEPLSAEAAAESLVKQLQSKDFQLSSDCQDLIESTMQELQQAPDWASNGDVRKLLNSVVSLQKAAFIQARQAGQPIPAKEIQLSALRSGLEQLLAEKRAKISKPDPSEQLRQLLSGWPS